MSRDTPAEVRDKARSILRLVEVRPGELATIEHLSFNPLDPMGVVSALRAAISALTSETSRWRELDDASFDGNPDALGTLADTIWDLADQEDDRAVLLEKQQGALPSVIVGVTGASLVDSVGAFRDLARVHRDGLRTLRRVVSAYASALRTAQHDLDTHTGDLSDAARRLDGLDPNWTAFLSPVTFWTEIERIGSEARAAYRDAESALRDVICDCDTLIDAEDELRRGLSDAEGYCLLYDVPIPDGMKVVDVVNARVVIPAENLRNGEVGDPDVAVLNDEEWERFTEKWNGLSEADRQALGSELTGADPVARALAMSALATGATLAAVLGLVRGMKGMSRRSLNEIANLRTMPGKVTEPTASAGNSAYIQYTGTTCGPTSAIALNAAKDPFVAYWLATGKTINGHTPNFLRGIDLSQAGTTGEERATFLENAVQDRANKVGGVTVYPQVIGIRPGGMAEQVSLSGTTYESAWANDVALSGAAGIAPGARAAGLDSSLNTAVDVVNSGTPVPLLVGGGDGVLPRHYVLAVGYHDGQFQIYDPGDGLTKSISYADLVEHPGGSQNALGNWERVYAVYLPKN